MSLRTCRVCCRLRQQHLALRTGVQKHVAVDDKYYAFTREGDGERLLIVFHNGDADENITFDLANTSILDMKALTPIFGSAPVRLETGKLSVWMAGNSVVIYQVQ